MCYNIFGNVKEKGEAKMEAGNFKIFELLKRINDTIEKTSNSSLQSNDLTLSQLKMLFFILHAENAPDKSCMPLKTLEKRFGVAQSTAAGIIQRLEKKGLVESVANEEDKRIKLLMVTDKGKSICESAAQGMDRLIDKSLSSFTEKEKKYLEELLRKLLNNIE